MLNEQKRRDNRTDSNSILKSDAMHQIIYFNQKKKLFEKISVILLPVYVIFFLHKRWKYGYILQVAPHHLLEPSNILKVEAMPISYARER